MRPRLRSSLVGGDQATNNKVQNVLIEVIKTIHTCCPEYIARSFYSPPRHRCHRKYQNTTFYPVSPMGPSRNKRARTKPPLGEEPVKSKSDVQSSAEAPAEAGPSTPAQPSTPALKPTQNDSITREASAASARSTKTDTSSVKQVSVELKSILTI